MGIREFNGITAGVDEVGRGPLAGPVVAAAVVLPAGVEIAGLKDSKAMTRRQRELCAQEIQRVALAIGFGWVSPRTIDRMNILQATFKAMRLAVAQIGCVDLVQVDGPLPIPGLEVNQQAIIDGDAQIQRIAAASILAKVARDEYMRAQARKYPGYGWERNMGYGTREHLLALAQYGPTPLHRFSFTPVRQAAIFRGRVMADAENQA